MHDLWKVCTQPSAESHVKTMATNLCTFAGLNDPENGLSASYEKKMTALFASKTQLTSEPEIVVAKTYKDTLEEAIHFLCSEAKPPKKGSRGRGESQVAAELVVAMLLNYLRLGKTVPLVTMYICGYYLRFVSVTAPKSYVEALVSKSLSGVYERPIFTTYPAYDTTKSEKSQGFNLLNAEERAAAVATLIQLRHNMICACPVDKGKK